MCFQFQKGSRDRIIPRALLASKQGKSMALEVTLPQTTRYMDTKEKYPLVSTSTCMYTHKETLTHTDTHAHGPIDVRNAQHDIHKTYNETTIGHDLLYNICQCCEGLL